MTNKSESLHELPADLARTLNVIPGAQIAWDDITLLARNEWICWILSAKKPQTRSQRIIRTCNDLVAGKRRPCCWPGCIHRKKNIPE